MKPIWNDIIPEQDLQIYKEAGFSGGKVGMGKRPVILIIDVQYRTVGEDKPTLESIRESGYTSSCGASAWSAIKHIQTILKKGREKNIPVIYPIVVRSDRFDAGRWADKNPSFGSSNIHRVGDKGTQIVEEIAPKEEDIIISKRYASAFFGTHLITQLQLLNADTLIVMGATTSGCVRASVVDAFSYGFKVLVPFGAVYDRGITSHKVGLFDMNAKYADVVSTEELIKEMSRL